MDNPNRYSSQLRRETRLLRTKLLVPPAHADLVPRSRLMQRLDQALYRKLTTVCGPAGSGKTTLISDWIRERALRVSWVSLDKADNDTRRFWSYVAAALDGIHPGVGAAALASLQAPQSPPFEVILADLVNGVAAVPDEMLLVLDDYHAIAAAEIHGMLGFLLQHLPPQMHVITASRSEPPLPLALLRAHRQLCELRANDMRFTPREITEFLDKVLGVRLSAEDTLTLERRTEGWAAALQLAGVALQEVEDTSDFIRSFGGGHRYVFDYLAQEILAHQTPSVRSFLLNTGILGRLNGPLCDAVTGSAGGQQMLQRLEAANLLLTPCDQERHWYRYHQLFAEFLRLQIEEEVGADQVAALHRRASAWYKKHDFLDDAVDHSLAAKDYDNVVRIIESSADQAFWRSELHSLIRWISALPKDLLDARPKLWLIDAWALLAAGHPAAEVEHRLQAIERALGTPAEVLTTEEARTLAPEALAALVEVTIVRSSFAMTDLNPPRILGLVQQALPYLAENVEARLFHELIELRPVASFNTGLAYELSGEITAAAGSFAEAIQLSRTQKNLHLLPMALSHLAQLQMMQGLLHRAADTYQEALRSVAEFEAPASPLVSMVHAGLGNVFYEWNDLTTALTHLEQGIAIGKRWNNMESLSLGYLGLARVRQAQGDWQGAFAALDELAELCRLVDTPAVLPAVENTRLRLRTWRGDLPAVARWVEASTIPLNSEQEPMYLREGEATTLARALVALGRLEEAQRLLARLLPAAEAGQRSSRTIEILVIQALAYAAAGQMPAAQQVLERALELGEPEGFFRVFVDEGAAVAGLLRSVATTASSGYVRRLLATLGANKAGAGKPDGQSTSRSSSPSLQPVLIEPLSDRELEVLALLAEGLKNEEIAEALVVSVNTVKTHVSNIYGKLRVRNRTEALKRAQALDLL